MSSESDFEDRTTRLVINGVTFQELTQQSLPCFAPYPIDAKIYIFISDNDALQILQMPTDIAREVILSCAIVTNNAVESSETIFAAIREDEHPINPYVEPNQIKDDIVYGGSET